MMTYKGYTITMNSGNGYYYVTDKNDELFLAGTISSIKEAKHLINLNQLQGV